MCNPEMFSNSKKKDMKVSHPKAHRSPSRRHLVLYEPTHDLRWIEVGTKKSQNKHG